MDQGLIPNRYAKALYKFALDKGEASRVYELMKNVAASFAGQPPLGDVMANPYVPSGDKTGLMMTAARASESDDCYAVFLKLVRLPDGEMSRLKSLVEKHLGDATVEFTKDVDPDLIGGFVVTVNSERLDASVSNEIKQLRLKLLSN